MNRLDSETCAKVINCLIEGCSIRATVRLTGVSKKAVARLLPEVGAVCGQYQDRVFRNLSCRRLQLDEMWTWIYCKANNRTEEIARKNPEAGDIWLWVAVAGKPDSRYISTSFIERQNWTVCTTVRRYTRLSNGFSRKLENHAAAVALNYFAYNFIKIHQTLRTSPSMAAGVADRLWNVEDLVALWESYEQRRAERAA